MHSLASRLAVAIILAALAVRLGAGVWWQSRLPAGQRFFFGDSDGYWRLGQHLARGEPYEYESADAQVFRMPGYPLMLAAMFRLTGDDPSVMAGRALSALLGTATVGLVIGWGSWLLGPRAGLTAGALVAIYPGALAMSAFVLSEAAFCPLMIAQLWLWGVASRARTARARWWSTAGAGLAAGLATLVRPSWLLFTPLACLAVVVPGPERRLQFAIGAGVLLLLLACLVPWWVRNARVTGHFVPTTLQVGASLYDGLNPQATGASDMQFVAEFTERVKSEQPVGGGTDSFEYRLDRRLRDEALAWASSEPRRVLQLAGIKVGRLWNIWPNDAELRSWPLRLVTLVSYVPLLTAGLWGAVRFRRGGWPFVLAWLPAVYFTLLHSVFVSSIRYREPAMLALAVLAAGAIAGGRPREFALPTTIVPES